jgi:hypothetical protein
VCGYATREDRRWSRSRADAAASGGEAADA